MDATCEALTCACGAGAVAAGLSLVASAVPSLAGAGAGAARAASSLSTRACLSPVLSSPSLSSSLRSSCTGTKRQLGKARHRADLTRCEWVRPDRDFELLHVLDLQCAHGSLAERPTICSNASALFPCVTGALTPSRRVPLIHSLVASTLEPCSMSAVYWDTAGARLQPASACRGVS